MSLKNIELYEAVVSNQQLEEIRYVHDGLFFLLDLVLCHGGWERVHGRVQKPSTAGHLIDHLGLEIPFVFSLRQQYPSYTNLETAIPRSVQARSVTEGRLLLTLSDSSCISCEEGTEHRPPNTSTLHPDKRGQGLLSSQRFRCSG